MKIKKKTLFMDVKKYLKITKKWYVISKIEGPRSWTTIS